MSPTAPTKKDRIESQKLSDSRDFIKSKACVDGEVIKAESKGPVDDESPFAVVAIGASAGGLEALKEIFSQIKKGPGLAYVVIQHQSPDFESFMEELLSPCTELKVKQVRRGGPIKKDHVYLLAPGKEMTICKGRFSVRDRASGSQFFPIDIFMKSLASDFGKSAIGVILSGTGHDGSEGVRHIHEAGGVTIVQHPSSTAFASMPRNAISTECVDQVLGVSQISEKLMLIDPDSEDALSIFKESKVVNPFVKRYEPILNLLMNRYNINFNSYKTSTISRRISRQMENVQIREIDKFLRFLEKDEEQLQKLYNNLFIEVTEFFRNPSYFELLSSEVIPEIVEKVSLSKSGRIWVPGCATGEEAYSIAILVHEAAEKLRKPYNVKIFATDISQSAINKASAGFYSPESLRNVSKERLKRYFLKSGDQYQVSSELRQMIVFAHHNLLKDPPFTQMDMISCRNLLIYLKPIEQQKVISLFHFGLVKDGTLMLGDSENLGKLKDQFKELEGGLRVFKKTGTASLRAPMLFEINRHKIEECRGKKSIHKVLEKSEPELSGVIEDILENCVKPTILINNKRLVLRTFGNVSSYLCVENNIDKKDFISRLKPGLKAPMAEIITSILKKGSSLVSRYIHLSNNNVQSSVKVTGRQISDLKHNQNLLLITFEPVLDHENSGELKAKIEDEIEDGKYSRLKEELSYTQQVLQNTIEELQVANVELQSNNEEMLVANEELKSTNEELNSVNEELLCVNRQYSMKVSELLETTDDLNNLMQSVDVGTIFLDNDLKIRKFTSAVRNAIYLSKKHIGKKISDINSSLIDSQTLGEYCQSVLLSGINIEREIKNKHGDWFKININPYRSNNKVSNGIVITFFDVTDLKEQNHQLKEAEARYRSLFDHSPDGILLIDPYTGEIIEANHSLSKETGFSVSELQGMNISKLRPLESKEAWRRRLEEIEKASVIYFKETHLCKKGNTKEVLIAAKFVNLRGRKYLQTIARDITELSQTRDNLEHTTALLEAKNSELENFVHTVSHDLKSPIVTVKGLVGWIKRNLDKHDLENAYNDLGRVERTMDRMSQLIKQILDLSRSGRAVGNLSPVSLNSIIDDVLENFSSQIVASNVRVEVDENLPVIYCDQMRVRQVFQNLIDNAIKYMGDQVSPSIVIDSIDDKERSVVRIKDNGRGIKSCDEKSIFDLFWKLDSNNEGSGVGLAIAKKIMEAHEGKIWVKSEGAGRGSEFYLEFPSKRLDKDYQFDNMAGLTGMNSELN